MGSGVAVALQPAFGLTVAADTAAAVTYSLLDWRLIVIAAGEGPPPVLDVPRQVEGGRAAVASAPVYDHILRWRRDGAPLRELAEARRVIGERLRN